MLAVRRPSFPAVATKERLIKCADAACRSFQIASRACRFEKAARLRASTIARCIDIVKIRSKNKKTPPPIFIQRKKVI